MSAHAPALVLALALTVPLSISADVRITEVMYDTDGADTKREWIEIYNAGADAVDISKWKFSDKSAHTLNTPPKNGGSGSLTLQPGSYAILASDATTFSDEHPGIATVIDTTMSLGNTAASISMSNGTAVVDTVSYSKALGGAGNGDSLQLHAGGWIHARPTPGSVNATESSRVVVTQSAAKAPTPTKTKITPAAVRLKSVEAEEVANDPLVLVNATPSDQLVAQTAAAGTLGGSYWWFAAAALALGSAAAASLISRTKKQEWDIEESD